MATRQATRSALFAARGGHRPFLRSLTQAVIGLKLRYVSLNKMMISQRDAYLT